MNQIVLRQELRQIVLQGGPVVANILPFTAVSTVNNQTVFTMLGPDGNPISFTTVICLFIMGVGQNVLMADYTVNGNQVTLSQGVPVGYAIFGAGQI